MAQGIFTDLCEIKEHTPLGLRVTITACGFDQKGYGFYEFTIERAEKGIPELSGVYVGSQWTSMHLPVLKISLGEMAG